MKFTIVATLTLLWSLSIGSFAESHADSAVQSELVHLLNSLNGANEPVSTRRASSTSDNITHTIEDIFNTTIEPDAVSQCDVDRQVCLAKADTINPRLIVGVLSSVDPTGGQLTEAVFALLQSFASGQGIDVRSLLAVGVILLTETEIASLIGTLLLGENLGNALSNLLDTVLSGRSTGANAINVISIIDRLDLAETALTALITTVVSTLTMGDTKAVLTVVRLVVNVLSDLIGIDLPNLGIPGGTPTDDTVSISDDKVGNDDEPNGKTKDKKAKKSSRRVHRERRLKGERRARRLHTPSVRRTLQLSPDVTLDIMTLLKAEGEEMTISHGSHTHHVSIRDELGTVSLIEVANLFGALRGMVEPLRDNRASQLWNSALNDMDNVTVSANKNDKDKGSSGKKPKEPVQEPERRRPLANLIQNLAQLLTTDLVASIVTALVQLLTQTTEQLAATNSASITVDGPFTYLGGLIGLASRSLEKHETGHDFFVPGLVQLVASLAMYQGTYAYLDEHYPQFANTTRPEMTASVDDIERQMHGILVDVSRALDLTVVAAGGATPAVSEDDVTSLTEGINCNLELLACQTTTSVFTGTSL